MVQSVCSPADAAKTDRVQATRLFNAALARRLPAGGPAAGGGGWCAGFLDVTRATSTPDGAVSARALPACPAPLLA